MAEDRANGLTQQIFSQKQPLVSVIIPCYNAEKYVEQAVRSIMNQTYKNLEILITDDCSTDASFAILQKLAEEDDRIKLFRNTENQKIVRTLNALVGRAAGKYIARMDADDISLPKRIEAQVQFMEGHKECGLCGCNILRIDEFGKKLKKIVFPTSYSDNTFFSLFSPTLCHSSVLGKREVFIENKYDEKYDGRSAAHIDLKAFDYFESAAFFPSFSLEEKLLAYGILGGVPSYLESFDDSKSIEQNIASKILRNGAFLKAEPPFCSVRNCENQPFTTAFLRQLREARAESMILPQRFTKSLKSVQNT